MTRQALRLGLAALLAATLVVPALAADPAGNDVATAAAKSAAIEGARMRLATRPSPSGTAALIEAQEALRRYQQAPMDRKTEAQAILDAAIARLHMESEAPPARP